VVYARSWEQGMTTRFAKGTKVLEAQTEPEPLARYMACDGCRNKLVCERCTDEWLCWICRYERTKGVDDIIGKTFTLEPITGVLRTKPRSNISS
jgi:hypothetical protein